MFTSLLPWTLQPSTLPPLSCSPAPLDHLPSSTFSHLSEMGNISRLQRAKAEKGPTLKTDSNRLSQEQEDAKHSAENIALKARQSKLTLADSKYSPISTLNNTRSRGTQARIHTPQTIEKETTWGLKTPPSTEREPRDIEKGADQEPAMIHDPLERDNWGIRTGLVSSIKTGSFPNQKSVEGETGELALIYLNVRQSHMCSPFLGQMDNKATLFMEARPKPIDYSQLVAIRNKGPPILNPNYDPREASDPGDSSLHFLLL